MRRILATFLAAIALASLMSAVNEVHEDQYCKTLGTNCNTWRNSYCDTELERCLRCSVDQQFKKCTDCEEGTEGGECEVLANIDCGYIILKKCDLSGNCFGAESAYPSSPCDGDGIGIEATFCSTNVPCTSPSPSEGN